MSKKNKYTAGKPPEGEPADQDTGSEEGKDNTSQTSLASEKVDWSAGNVDVIIDLDEDTEFQTRKALGLDSALTYAYFLITRGRLRGAGVQFTFSGIQHTLKLTPARSEPEPA